MGKHRHQKDKLWLIPSEYAEVWGGYKAANKRLPFKCLPFNCCGLTLLPFKDPVCVRGGEGIVFDKGAILAWLTMYHQCPVTGKPLSRKDLVDLHFHKNVNNEYHCPITFKVFTENSEIVANLKSGHVYSKEAIDEVCRKGKSWLDLITGEKFSPKDLQVLQSRNTFSQRTIEQFKFIKHNIPFDAEAHNPDKVESVCGISSTCQPSQLMRETLKEAETLGESRKRAHEALISGPPDDSVVTADKSKRFHPLFTTSAQAASFTSTTVAKSTTTQYRSLSDSEIREELYSVVRKKKLKSYVKIVTSHGPLSIELHSQLVPLTVHNFLLLAESGYYDNTIFHRIIPRFMVQGGDPTGVGTGGKCAFEGLASFPDEFHPDLKHDRRGVLSMANSGVDTNKSQFFITFAPASHLDERHSVFGLVIGGMETLSKLENVKIDAKNGNRPLNPVPRILSVQTFKDAFADASSILQGGQPDGKRSRKAVEEDDREKSESFIKSLTG